MGPMLVRSRPSGLSGTGVLADRALLVVSEYLERGVLPPDGEDILTRFRNRFEQAREEVARPGSRSSGISSVDALAASELALRSLAPDAGATHEEVPTIESILATVNQLLETGHANEEKVRVLRAFLDQYGEHTLAQAGPRLGNLLKLG